MSAPELVFLKRQEVERKTRLSRSAIYDLMSKGAFPRPIRVGEGASNARVAWLLDEVEMWMLQRVGRTLAERAAGRPIPNSTPRRGAQQKENAATAPQATTHAVVAIRADGRRTLFGRYRTFVEAKAAAVSLGKVGLRAEVERDVDPALRPGQRVPERAAA